MSQPIAMRPFGVSTALRSSSAFSNTTVLATERLRPKTSPAPKLQPQRAAMPAPIAVAMTICPMAPGMAIRRTAIRSATEKCKPTPNMSRMTPISANCPDIALSATNPGVDGPIDTPARRYPTNGGNPKRIAMKPKAKASANPMAMVAISSTSCGMDPPVSLVARRLCRH